MGSWYNSSGIYASKDGRRELCDLLQQRILREDRQVRLPTSKTWSLWESVRKLLSWCVRRTRLLQESHSKHKRWVLSKWHHLSALLRRRQWSQAIWVFTWALAPTSTICADLNSLQDLILARGIVFFVNLVGLRVGSILPTQNQSWTLPTWSLWTSCPTSCSACSNR